MVLIDPLKEARDETKGAIDGGFGKTFLPQPEDVLVDVGGGELPGEFGGLPDQAPPGEKDMLDGVFLVLQLALLDPVFECPAPFSQTA